jgi:hypothetical protein
MTPRLNLIVPYSSCNEITAVFRGGASLRTVIKRDLATFPLVLQTYNQIIIVNTFDLGSFPYFDFAILVICQDLTEFLPLLVRSVFSQTE